MDTKYFYTTLTKTPIGDLFIAGSDRGINYLQLNARTEKDSIQRFKKQFGHTPEKNNYQMSGAVKQLKEYLSGKRNKFDLKVDLSGTTDFRKNVYKQLLKVKSGKTISYGQLASKAGNKDASRAVGSAMASNPVPIIIPCHRVLRSDGDLGGFGGGLNMKRKLLEIEGVK
ncbi:MAG: methylated-DNA--[protein]-cysteine S-methyltransferase [candidate division Zixibacteria bacterium]|nr:methylated-DNA--[protein]-cysteine S-methyltransferase [candidate division Zixibacteria bacterium]